MSSSLNNGDWHLVVETSPEVELVSQKQGKRTTRQHKKITKKSRDENSNKGNSIASSGVFCLLCSKPEIKIGVRPINVACSGVWN